MREWARRPGSRPSAWFASVATLTAVVVAFCGSGLGDDAPAVGQTEPLALSLSAPQTCGTTPVEEALESRAGRLHRFGWRISEPPYGEIDVSWIISGGAPPYTLTIDGATRDAAGTFIGQSGTGSVSCALTHGAAFWLRDFGPRYFSEKPVVDSGLKTIRATVTDSAGATARASVNVYAILELGSSGDVLGAGKTYRAPGGLLTVPVGVDLRIGSFVDGDGGAPFYLLEVVGTSAYIALETRAHHEVARRAALPRRD